MSKKISLVVPCFGRPLRTKRMINCILNQNMFDWEVFLIGDRCPDFNEMMMSDYYSHRFQEAYKRGSLVQVINFGIRYRGYGYHAINTAIKLANSEYFMFAGNDDIILDNHFEHYLSGIDGSDFNFAYYNTWVHPHEKLRMSQLFFGGVGHSELIVRTDFIKTIEPHTPNYGHDWEFIQNMMKRTTKHIKVSDESPTYYVMSVPGKTRDTID